jgi:hypothetical protein
MKKLFTFLIFNRNSLSFYNYNDLIIILVSFGRLRVPCCSCKQNHSGFGRGISLGIDVCVRSGVGVAGRTSSVYAGEVGVACRALVFMPVDQVALVLDVDLKGGFGLDGSAEGRGGTLLERSAVQVVIVMRWRRLDAGA